MSISYVPPQIMTYTTTGVVSYRTKVLYVSQRPSLLPGSPHEFLTAITSLGIHKSKPLYRRQRNPADEILERAYQIGEAWGIDQDLWARTWGNLSGGEAQRILLASAMAMDTAEVLLLDGELLKRIACRRYIYHL